MEYSQEGSKPSNPAHNGQDDPAGDTAEILGDDTGGTKSDVTGFMKISNLAATTSPKSLQYVAEANGDGGRFPSPSIRTDNDEVLGATYAGDAPLHEGPDGGVVLGTLTLPPGVQTTRSGHKMSVGSGIVIADGTSYTLKTSSGKVITRSLRLPVGVQTTRSGRVVSAGSDLVVVDGISYTVDASNGGVIPGTLTLPPRAHTTYLGHSISVSSGLILVDSISYTLVAGGAEALQELMNDIASSSTTPDPSRPIKGSNVLSTGQDNDFAQTPFTTAAPSGPNIANLIMSAFGNGPAAAMTTHVSLSEPSAAAFPGGRNEGAINLSFGLATASILVQPHHMYSYIVRP